MKTSYVFLFCVAGMPCFGQLPDIPAYKDILINEVFIDPTPSVGLPEKEFVEVYNASAAAIELENLSISDADKTYPFPAFALQPGAYLILCKTTDVSYFKDFGSVLGFSSFITLNNEGDEVSLSAASGNLIDRFAYTQTSYAAGRSLELIDPFYRCNVMSNWQVSLDPRGGTPGIKNSLLQHPVDSLVPAVTEISCVSDSVIRLLFNTSFSVQSVDKAGFLIDDGNITARASGYSEQTGELILSASRSMMEGRFYMLSISGLVTCNGTATAPLDKEFVISQQADSLDIVINELMFNPAQGHYDFIELYNASSKFIDLRGWQLANRQNGLISNMKNITVSPLLLYPGSYVVFTPDKEDLWAQYPDSRKGMVVETELPSWNDDGGCAILIAPGTTQIDQFNYNADFHFKLLEDKEGVSLERISFQGPTDSRNNWHSAAAAAGFATPGYENSQSYHPASVQNWSIDPVAFSPNGDGYKDFTAINYVFPTAGKMASVNIYDVQGRQVRRLLSNASLPAQGFIQWDGTDEGSAIAPIGQYIICIEAFDLLGRKEELKKTVVLTKKD